MDGQKSRRQLNFFSTITITHQCPVCSIEHPTFVYFAHYIYNNIVVNRIVVSEFFSCGVENI